MPFSNQEFLTRLTGDPILDAPDESTGRLSNTNFLSRLQSVEVAPAPLSTPVEEDGGLFEPITKTASAIASGFHRLRQSANLIQGDFDELAEVTRTLDDNTYAPSAAFQKFQEAEGGDAVIQFLKNPLIAVEIAANSAATSIPALAGGAVGGFLGGLAGAPAAGVGAAPGVLYGTGAGVAFGSGLVDGTLKFLEELTEEGVDLRDPASIEAAFGDDALIERARNKAVIRGATVGVIDGLTLGLSSKFGNIAKGLFKAGKVKEGVKAGLKGLGVEATGGATGEVAGSLAVGDEIRVPDVLAEAIGELVPGLAEIALSTRGGVTTARAIRQAEKEGSATPYEPEVPVEETPDGETKPFGADLTPGQWTRRMGIAKDLYGKGLRDLTAEERRVVEVKASKEEVMEPERPPTPYPPPVPEPEGEVEVEEPGSTPDGKDERDFDTAIAEDVGDFQRGDPERAMDDIKDEKITSSLYGHVAMHIGDITHRMAHSGVRQIGFGFKHVADKVEKTIGWLTDRYGFEKEVNEQIRYERNRRGGGDFAADRARQDALGELYSQAHEKIRPHNEVQRVARDAAIAFGRNDFDEAIRLLEILKSHTDQGEAHWIEVASIDGREVSPAVTPTPESKDPAGEAETPAPPDVKVGDIVFYKGENHFVDSVESNGTALTLRDGPPSYLSGSPRPGAGSLVVGADEVTLVPPTLFTIGDKVTHKGVPGEITDAVFNREDMGVDEHGGRLIDEPVYSFKPKFGRKFGSVTTGLRASDILPQSMNRLDSDRRLDRDAEQKGLRDARQVEKDHPDTLYGSDQAHPKWTKKHNNAKQQVIASTEVRAGPAIAIIRRVTGRVLPSGKLGKAKLTYHAVQGRYVSKPLSSSMDFTRGNIAPDELGVALQMLEGYLKRDKALLKAYPDGPFTGNSETVIATDSVEPAYVAWVKKIRSELGITTKFFLSTVEDLSVPGLVEKHHLYGGEYGVNSSPLRLQVLAHPRSTAHGATLVDRRFAPIAYHHSKRKSVELETLAHEVGHSFERYTLENLTSKEMKEFAEAFKAHLDLRGVALSSEFLKAHASLKFYEEFFMPKKTGEGVSETMLAVDLPDYYGTAKEFLANQVAKWAVSSEQPVSALDKFFKRLADGFRRLYASAKGQDNLPNAEIKRILDRRAESIIRAGEDFQGRVESLAEAEDIQRGKDADAEADRAVQAEEEVEEETVEPKYKRTTPALGTIERDEIRKEMLRRQREEIRLREELKVAEEALRKTKRRVRSSKSPALKEKKDAYDAAVDRWDEIFKKSEEIRETHDKALLEDRAESSDTAASLGALVALGEVEAGDVRAEITEYVEKIAEDENIAKDVRKEAVKDTVGAALNGTVEDTASSLKYSVERIRREQAEQTARDLKATALEEEKAEARKKVEALSSLTDEQRQSYLDQIDKATEIGDEYRGSSTVAGSVKQAIEANDKASEASDKEAARLKALGGDRSVVEAGANELYNKPFDELNKTQKRKVLYSKLLDMERGFPVSDLTEAELLELSKNVQLVAEAKDRDPSLMSKKFGFITNGHFLVLDKAVAKKLRDAYWRNELKKAKTDVAEKAVLAERATVDKEDGPDTSPLIPGVKGDSLFFQGYSGRRDNTPIAIYSTGSKQIKFDAEYIAAIKKLFPNAKLTMPEGKDGRSPATFVEGGKIKALVMPLAPRDSDYSIDPAFRPGDAVVEPTIQSLETEIAEEPQANLLGEVEEVEETEADTDTQDRQIESLETSIGDSYQGTDMNESPNTPELSHLETLVTTEPEENVLRREATKKSGVGTMVSVDPKGSEGFWKTILKSAGLGSLREFKFHHVETLSIFREWAKKAGARAEEVVSVARHITGIDKLRAGMMINPGKTGELWNSPTDHLGNDLRDSQGVKVKSVVEIFETVKQRGLSDEASRYIAARTGLTRYYTRSNNKTINEMSQDVWDFFLARREMQVGEVKEAVAKFIEDEVISEVQGEAIIANLGVLKDDVTQNADHILDTVNPGFSRAEAEAIKAEGDNNLILKDAADDFFRLTDALLTFMEKMSPNLHDRLQLMRDVSYNAKTNLYEYAPLVKVRAIDDVRARFSGIFDKNAVSKFSRVSGVSSATDPITDPVLQWVLSVSPMIKGAARAQLMDAIAAHIGPSTMGDTELVSAKEAGVSLEEQKINEALAKESGDGEGAMLLFDMLEPARASSRDGKPIFTLRQGKEVVYVKVHDELLFKGITGVDTRNMGAAFDLFFGMPARMLRMGATGLSLGFNFFTNPIRDFVQILGQSELRGPKGLNTFELVAFWGQAAAMVFRDRASRAGISSIGNKESNAEFMELYRRLGVHMGKLLNVDAAQAKNLTAQVEGRAKEHYKGMLDNIADYLTGSEDVGRISVGLATLKVWEKQGRIKANADGSLPKLSDTDMRDLANIMQQGSIDFRQGGDFGKVINQMIPFWNVNILGIERFRKSVEDNPKGTILWGLTAITLPTLALWAMNRDEDWYKRLTPDQKALYWHFNLPGTDTVLRIPKSFEWGSLFGTVPEALFERLVSENPDHADEILGSVAGLLSPLQSGKDLVSFETLLANLPLTARVGAEYATNRDFFFNRSIVPESERFLPPGEQKSAFTSGLARLAGEMFPDTISPRKVDFLVRSLTGGLGSDIVGAIDFVLLGQDRSDSIQNFAAGELAELPVIGRGFLRGGTKGSRSRFVDKIYEDLGVANARSRSKDRPETEAQRDYREQVTMATGIISSLHRMAYELDTREQRIKIREAINQVAKNGLKDRPDYRDSADLEPVDVEFSTYLRASGDERNLLLWKEGQDYAASHPDAKAKDIKEFVRGLPAYKAVSNYTKRVNQILNADLPDAADKIAELTLRLKDDSVTTGAELASEIIAKFVEDPKTARAFATERSGKNFGVTIRELFGTSARFKTLIRSAKMKEVLGIPDALDDALNVIAEKQINTGVPLSVFRDEIEELARRHKISFGIAFKRFRALASQRRQAVRAITPVGA